MLSAAELSRYQRQLVLPEVGLDGQRRLAEARVLVVGAGGLGSPAAIYLAAAGIGHIGIVDDDVVEASNLHRQILHGTADIGRPKPASAADALQRLNPHVRVETFNERLTAARAESLFADFELVVDGSDNYATRYAVNDACARLRTPWVYGSVERFAGQVSVFCAGDGPCYRCIFPEPPAAGTTASCEEIGVLGAVPGVVGSMQAVEALKVLLNIGEPLVGRLVHMDLQGAGVRIIEFGRRADCPACAPQAAVSPASNGSSRAPNVGRDEETDIDPHELARRLGETPTLQLLDIREPWEWSIAAIPRSQRTRASELPAALDSLDRSRELIVYCHHGARSGMAAEWLRSQGFLARNLAGGIDRWSREVDPKVPRY